MNTYKFKLFAVLWGLFLAFTACQPEEFTMGKIFSKDELKYSITQDKNDPNMIILESLTPGATPLWITPMGRSTQIKDTVQIPFAGEYNFTYGVESAGGYVQADAYKLSLTTNNLNYVNDPLWTLLSGGVGKEKTWVLDLNASSVSKFFQGPLYFYGTADSWITVTDKQTVTGDTWNWQPDYKGNSWLMSAGDYGSMTFSLKDGAKITVDHKMLSKTQTGTYFLDATAKTLKMTDAAPLHDSGRNGVVIDWGNLKVMSLTENTMQLAALRDPALSGEGACLLVYNFISKDYSDKWVPPVLKDPEPSLPDGWANDISMTVSYNVKWVLSPETPFNWANLDGSLMNPWNKLTDYADWTGFNASVPATYSKFSLTLNSKEKSAVFVAPDGKSTGGSYTLDEKGIYSFNGVKPAFNICSWVNLSTTAENQWRITKIEKDATGAISGMWVGAKDPAKPEYMVYHLIPQLGNVAVDPLAGWKSALVGKTFTPDVNWFVDWVNFPPDFTGGWTSATTFGNDFTSNGWVWDANVKAVAESASLAFKMVGDNMKVTLTQKKDGADYTATGDVVIDPEKNILKISIPLVDYAGTAASWLPTTNTKATSGDVHDWYFASHGGSNLTNMSTAGLWLGLVSNSTAKGDTKDEVLLYHFTIK